METIPEFVVIGHVTRDIVAGGAFRDGGTATYSALTADRLGLCAGVLTSASDRPLFLDSPSIRVSRRPSAHTTTFENVYLDHGRRQYVRSVAEPLSVVDLPVGWAEASVVHLGPVAQEVDPRFTEAFATATIGITPQGWLRHWGQDGLVKPIAWRDARELLSRADAVVLSMEDLGGDRAQFQEYLRWARLAVLTEGPLGATVYHQGQAQRVPAYEADEVDPTGAGDVFAAAFLIRLRETGEPLEAARFANCVASFVVEGFGATNIPTREQAEWRLAHGRLRR